MGDDLSMPGRMGVRTPMQWSEEANGGFSAAPAEALVRKPVTDDRFGYHVVNVDRQRRDPDSLLNFFLRLIRTRKECPELGLGDLELLDAGDPRVFAHACEWKGGVTIAFHNLSGEACDASYAFDEQEVPHLTDLLTDGAYEPITRRSGSFRLEPYGYRWMRISPFRRGAVLRNEEDGAGGS